METPFGRARLMVPILIMMIYLVAVGHPSFRIGVDAQQAPKGHFILVHGIPQGAWIWYKVATLLQQSGFQTTSVDLASAGRDQTIADTVTTLEQYAAPLTKILANITNEKVILVGHSFGGVSISLQLESFPTKVDKGIFLSGIAPKNGQSFTSTTPPSGIQDQLTTKALVAVYANASNPSQLTSYAIGPNATSIANIYYNESPPEDVTLALSLLKPQPAGPLSENLTLTDANYGSVPRYYIRTGKDNAVPPAVQSSIIANNPPKQVFSLDNADHASYFSQPVELAGLLTYIAAL